MKTIHALCFWDYLQSSDICHLNATQLEAVSELTGYDRDSLEDVAGVIIDVEGYEVFDKHPELFPVPVLEQWKKSEQKLVSTICNKRGN